ncbi:MAG: hypothetical protein ACPL88_02960, partial [Bryobacteraceae bacterium]
MGLLLYPAGAAWGRQPRLQEGNIYTIPAGGGFTEIEWVSSSAFRYARYWEAECRRSQRINGEKVPVAVSAAPESFDFTTRYLRVELIRAEGRLRVRDSSGRVLLADLTAPRRAGGRMIWERERAGDETFWGLGPTAELDGRGNFVGRIDTTTPFLMSNLGYGEFFPTGGVYAYVFGKTRRVEAPLVASEYFFYYGPTPKEILEEHLTVAGAPRRPDWESFRLGKRLPAEGAPLPEPEPSWEGLRRLLDWLLRCSYSAILLPAIEIRGWRAADEEVRRRAYQLASFAPIVYCSAGDASADERKLAEERERWLPFLASYGHEAQERGSPPIRPMHVQYPRDTVAREWTDQFM